MLDYTVIGDTVNLAFRLEGANKRYGTALMISEFTFRALRSDHYCIRMLDIIQVKGKSKAVKVYEVYGYQKDSLPFRQKNYCLFYEKAFAAYLEKDFSLGFEYFTRALALIPDDRAAKNMLVRIKALSCEDIPRDWDGSIQLTDK